MKTSDFYYDLPERLIAQNPLADRSSSRLMVLDKKTGRIEHKHFTDIKDYLHKGDVLVINNTRVIPARLLGVRSDTGSAVEILLLKRIDDIRWECIVRPGKKVKPGRRFTFIDGELEAECEEILDTGNRIVRFDFNGIWEEILDRAGTMPLPPYIHEQLKDRERYQTVYSKIEGSAAAPTAGLHFTKELLSEIKEMGVEIAEVTLHVGLGTFRPVKVDDVISIRFGEHIDADKAAVVAMFHDAGEIITGDMPTPVKYFNPDIISAYKAVEKAAEDKLLSMLPGDLRPAYEPLLSNDDPVLAVYVKAADKLSALIKCIEEVRMGNNEFMKAKEATERSLQQMDLPALKVFMDECLPAYYLTLDELG